MPILTTKFHIPPVRPELVSRSRLIGQLDAGIRSGRALTLVSASAGFGKTTLVSEWARGCGPHPRVAWLSLDQEDDDPTRFWTYLIAACQTVKADLGLGAQEALQSPHFVPAQSVLISLINDIASWSGRLVLVLDDYHLMSARAIHEGMAFLLDHMGGNMHVVVVARADPPLPLARMRVRDQLTEVREADLRFTLGEAVEFCNRAMDLALSEKEIARLETRTEGWIAGLQLAALSMRGREDTTGFVEAFDGSHRYVIDYLTEEVLQRQDDEVRDFVCQTAILDRLTASLCDAVTGRDAHGTSRSQRTSEDLLTQLERGNLFLVPLDDTREWYRYHRLFADAVRRQGEQDPADLHRRAARWYETHGFIDDAIEHALAAREVEKAARLISRASRDLWDRGQLVTLQTWLDALPEAYVRAHYEMALLKAWAWMAEAQGQVSRSYLESAQESLPQDAQPADRAGLIGLRAVFTRLYGDAAESVKLSRRALDLVGDADPFLRSLILLNLIETLPLVGDMDGTVQSALEIIHLGSEDNGRITMGAVSELVLLLAARGRLREAVTLGRETLERCVDAQGAPLPTASFVYICMGYLSYEMNDLAGGRRYLLKGLDLGQSQTMIGLVRLGRIWLARLQWAMGETEAAWETTRNARRIEEQLPPGLSFTGLWTAVQVDLLLRQGDIHAAARLAETARPLPSIIPRYLMTMEHIAYARLHLAQNQLEDARDILSDLERSARQEGRSGSLVRVYILKALVERASGHQDIAHSDLERALRLAASEGYRRAFLDEGQPLAELLPQARHVAPEFVDDLLDALEARERPVQAPDRESASLRAPVLVEALTHREREVIRLVANGLSNREIAQALFVTVGTIKKHLNNVFGKLDVKSRTQAVVRARELGLLP